MAKVRSYARAADIKVGVIGYGGAFNMGRGHLQEVKKAGMTPAAVCDKDEQRLAIAREDFPGIETYTSLDRMLNRSDVELVIHITPHNLHYPLAAKCLRAGRHVVTEKPFVLTTAQADKLIKLGEANGLMVSTYHNRHWDGWIRRARREIVDKARLGEIVRVEAVGGGYAMPREWWRSSRSISGGILYDWGVHLLEYSLQIVPSDLVEVTGFAHEGHWPSQMNGEHPWKHDCNEDEAWAIARFRNGAHVTLAMSQINSDGRPYQIGFFGTRGCYLINFRDGWTTRIANRAGKLVEKTGPHLKSRSDLYYKNVAGYLTGQEELVITPEWARRPIHILELAGRSARQGRAIKARYP